MNKEEKLEQNLPEFLYKDEGQIKIGWHGDSIVTDEWNKFLFEYTQQVSSPLIEILKVAKCQNCNGDETIWLNNDEIGQCQWCDERNKLTTKTKRDE